MRLQLSRLGDEALASILGLSVERLRRHRPASAGRPARFVPRRAASAAPPAKARRSLSRVSKDEQRIGALLYPERPARPQTRGECIDGPRPCPHVGCRHHLYLEVLDTGTITFAAPRREPWDFAPSCSLDLADAGHQTLEQVGDLFNLSRERIRQIEKKALVKLRLATPRGS